MAPGRANYNKTTIPEPHLYCVCVFTQRASEDRVALPVGRRGSLPSFLCRSVALSRSLTVDQMD